MSAVLEREWWRPEEEPTHSAAEPEAARTHGSTPFVAVIALLVIMVLSPQTHFPALAPLRIALLTAWLSGLSYAKARLAQKGGGVPIWSREMRLAAALFVWALFGAFFSYWPGGTVSFVVGVYSKTLVLFFLLSQVVDSMPRLLKTAWAMTLMAVPLALTAVQHFLVSSSAPGRGPSRIAGYEAPLTQNPNDLALMLNLVLPLSGALFLIHKRLSLRLLLLSLMLLDVAAIVCTFSRAGFLTLLTTFVIAGVKLLSHHRERGFVVLAIGLALAALPLLPSGYLDRLGTIADIHSDPTGSAQARWSDTLAATRLVLESPLIGAGAGVGTLALNAERGATWKEVHNVYLELALELGLPGLALFLALFAGCLCVARRARADSLDRPHLRELGCLAEGIEISLWAFAVAAFFHPVAYHFYFYWLAGLALALRFELRRRDESPQWWAGARGAVHA
jgi:O-antigen ligase